MTAAPASAPTRPNGRRSPARARAPARAQAGAPEPLALSPAAAAVGAAFRAAVAAMGPGRPLAILAHNDADGLSAGAIFARALEAVGREASLRVLGRGETPWSAAIAEELAAANPAGLVVTDLGTRDEPVVPGLPTILVDHHVPQSAPPRGDGTPLLILSGHAMQPSPTSSLLALWCAAGLGLEGGELERLLPLAAFGLIGDMAEGAGFPEMAAARARHRVTHLRDATALLNAPRRTASGDPGPALRLLLAADGPDAILAGTSEDARALLAARDEVRAALEAGKRVAPLVRNGVALIRLDTGCQIHPLVAQSWRGRLKGEIVLAANRGYRPGFVHFAVRSAASVDLIDFLARHRPEGAEDGAYGNGHAKATGGALADAVWPDFLRRLGFPPEAAAFPPTPLSTDAS